MIPILKTRLPDCHDLAPYIKEIDSNKIYTNYGPLNHRLRARLASLYNISEDNICLLSSGTAGLFACLWLIINDLSKHPSDVVVGVPAWTFIATAQVPFLLGVKVVFLDIDINGFVLPNQNIDIDVLIVVSPFGEYIDREYWKEYSQSTGVKVLYDCAASFSTLVVDEFPSVVSTHATKGFSTGEGGFVVCKNHHFIEKVKSFSNFGYSHSRISKNFGLNLKISEINCAYGLASMDNQDKYIKLT